MKFPLLLAVLLPPAAAQTTLTWDASREVGGAGVTFPVALEILDDGGSLTVDGVGPVDFSEAKPTQWRVARQGPNGALAWETVAAVPATAPGATLPAYVADAGADGASVIALQTGTSATLVRHDPFGVRLPDVVLVSPNTTLRVQPRFVRADPNGEVTVGVLESNPFTPASSNIAALTRLDAAGQVMWRYQVPNSSAQFDDAGSGRVAVSLDRSGSPAWFSDVTIVNASGVTVRTSSVDLTVGSQITKVAHDIANDTTYLLAQAGSTGDRLAAVDSSGAPSWAVTAFGNFYPEITLDPASGWIWLQPVQVFESRPGQIIPRSGRAVGLVTRGRRTLAKASFRPPSGFVGPLDIFLQQAIEGEAGQAYCAQVPNSTGEAARLVAAGSDVVAESVVTLVADRLPVGAFGLFLASQVQGSVPGAGGSLGTLCLGACCAYANSRSTPPELQSCVELNVT